MKLIQGWMVLLVAAACSTGSRSMGQSLKQRLGERTVYGIAVDGISVSGNWRDMYKQGLGGSLQVELPVARNIYATVNGGYLNFFGRNNVHNTGFSAQDLRLVPVKAGVKVFPFSILYLQGEAGAAFILNGADLLWKKSTAFIYVPQLGMQLPAGGAGNFIDIGVRYEKSAAFDSRADNSKLSFLGLRIAYAFSL